MYVDTNTTKGHDMRYYRTIEEIKKAAWNIEDAILTTCRTRAFFRVVGWDEIASIEPGDIKVARIYNGEFIDITREGREILN